ncbi:MAG: two-component sensor histidine kinase, partial [Methyloprofundus sp.]|nr:two-component sensor histidine kinase [Methyloprofundus sp.]
MLVNSPMLSPCPFSKGYTIPAAQAWSLLKGFYAYRLILACLFLIFFYSRLGAVLISTEKTQLYLYVSGFYFLFACAACVMVLYKKVSYAAQAQSAIFIDIFLITLIMHAAGGISSGVGALMLVTTAAGGLLVGGRCAMLFAALASLFVFAEQAYTFRVEGFNSAYYAYAGMLGAGFFCLAFLSYILAKRTEQSELISSQRKETIVSLEELNQYIIQNMPSGIIIIDQQQRVTSYNEASPRLLGEESLANTLLAVSVPLTLAFNNWLMDPHKNFVIISTSEQVELQVHFNSLPTKHALFFMITLEDVALYKQRVQQSKLASLGLLTANMAHEIRNPLGAISHAGQLLAESPDLAAEDVRLTEIIQTHALRMNLIIEDILQLSRRKDSRRECIHLKPWLEEFFIIFEAENPEHQNKFFLSFEEEIQDILFDSGHLTQILNNLCENAIKYGSAKT